ncbi:hypothetical protein AMC99_01037 [Altererythrobacter epoxidivorans]|uniref:Uncharacterized protein n=1 Tax=Altererythrobacter epoxidivorans TaxID=361183 RepID=A0A0M4LUM1_9SPHN|nr:hypothetical protein AMC99_01037 [Altererythrobacter epoxidivorans]
MRPLDPIIRFPRSISDRILAQPVWIAATDDTISYLLFIN